MSEVKLAKIFRIIDSETARDLINREGHEPNRPFSRYQELVFGSTIGNVEAHRRFYLYSELGDEVKLDWGYLHGLLNGRPISITIDELKKGIMPLLEKGVSAIYIFTKSMMLGLHSWSYNHPQTGETMRKIWGQDKWIFTASKIGTDFETGKPSEKPDYTEVNAYLKKIKAQYRVKFGKGFAKRLVARQDLWD